MSSAKSKAEVIAALQSDGWADRLGAAVFLPFVTTFVFIAAPVGFAWVLSVDDGFSFWPTLAVLVLLIDVPCAYLVYRVRRSIRLNEIPLTELDDPVFGPIKLRRKPAWWEGEVRFAPLGKDLCITISAGPQGPSLAQCELYRQIEGRYRDYLPEIMLALRAEVRGLIAAWDETSEETDYEYELVGLGLAEQLGDWTAQYQAHAAPDRARALEELGGEDSITYMSYFVNVSDWRIASIGLAD